MAILEFIIMVFIVSPIIGVLTAIAICAIWDKIKKP